MLEAELIEAFGEWWAYGKAANSSAQDGFTPEEDEDEEDEAVQDERRKAWEQREEWGAVVVPTVTRRVKLTHLPDVTLTRLSEKTGKPLKPYIGPPLSEYHAGPRLHPHQAHPVQPREPRPHLHPAHRQVWVEAEQVHQGGQELPAPAQGR
jgi:hypothetical protein